MNGHVQDFINGDIEDNDESPIIPVLPVSVPIIQPQITTPPILIAQMVQPNPVLLIQPPQVRDFLFFFVILVSNLCLIPRKDLDKKLTARLDPVYFIDDQCSLFLVSPFAGLIFL